MSEVRPPGGWRCGVRTAGCGPVAGRAAFAGRPCRCRRIHAGCSLPGLDAWVGAGILAARGPVLEIVSVWPLSGACRGDGSRSVSIAGCLPRWGGIGIFVWIFVAGVGLLPGFRVVIRRFLPDRPPEFSGIAVCRRCGRDFVK